jgi:hypothetical protein
MISTGTIALNAPFGSVSSKVAPMSAPAVVNTQSRRNRSCCVRSSRR